jgi:hypothetical protein
LGNGLYGALNSGGYGTGGYDPNSSSYGSDSSAYSLMGAANAVSAQAALMTSQQQAFLTKEMVRTQRIGNEQRFQELRLFARERTPTAEDERERSHAQERDHSRNDPSATEIWSGKALNVLLVDLQRGLAREVMRGDVGQARLPADVLDRINVSSLNSEGGAGLLRNEGRLDWPLALSGPEFKKQRDFLNLLVKRTADQPGQTNSDTLQELDRCTVSLQKDFTVRVKEFSPSQYLAAKHFLNDLESAVRTLHQPDAENYFNGAYKVGGKTMFELVKHMTERGLRFAPATEGDQSAYLALHRALAAYDFAAHAPEESYRR